MSDSSPRCACPFRNPVLLLAILLAVTTTGWVVTALNRERPAHPAARLVEPPADLHPGYWYPREGLYGR